MQLPWSFPGAPYDKDMFTFLPAPSNRDVLTESSRKRKSMASDDQITMPTPNMGYGFSVMSNAKLNAGDLRDKEVHLVQSSPPGQSSNFTDYNDKSRYWNHNNYTPPGHPNKGAFHETKPECTGYSSFGGQFKSPEHIESSPLFHMSVGSTHKTSHWPSSMTENLSVHGNVESNPYLARETNAPHFQQFQSFGQQEHGQMKDLALDSHGQASNNPRESQSLQQNCCKLGSSVSGLDACNFTGSETSKMSEDNVGNSVYNLPHETNNLLQNLTRLLNACSGIGIGDNFDGNIQGCGDDSKRTKLTPNSDNQNLSHCLTEKTLPEIVEPCPNVDKPNMSGEKGSVKLDEECKSENGTLVITEKLWDGTLQLSSSVSVSAIAFFKSGEKMQNFSWSESVEVKGKVKLEAFEKYVQDLPRSRTRGLMVISLCWKEGSSDADRKGMNEIARKYKQGKRVGFAQLSNGIDMYICPHSDTIITILAKHGFFKGMTAVKDKSDPDPLIGCVVWKKSSSSIPAGKTAEAGSAPQLNQSPSSLSDSSASQIAKENSTMANPNQEPVSSSSGKGSTLTDDREKSREDEKIPDFRGAIIESSELKTSMEHSKQSEVASDGDDDDLPEYDFRVAVFQTSVNNSLKVGGADLRLEPISAPMGSESSTISRPPLGDDFHFQGLIVPQNIGQQGLVVPQNIGHQPSLPVQEPKQNLKTKSLFDDDDMPEWCPPSFTKPRQEPAQRTGLLSHPKVPGLHFREEKYPSAPHLPTPLANKPGYGLMHKGPAFAPDFGPNPGFSPRFDPSVKRNPNLSSARRDSRP